MIDFAEGGKEKFEVLRMNMRNRKMKARFNKLRQDRLGQLNRYDDPTFQEKVHRISDQLAIVGDYDLTNADKITTPFITEFEKVMEFFEKFNILGLIQVAHRNKCHFQAVKLLRKEMHATVTAKRFSIQFLISLIGHAQICNELMEGDSELMINLIYILKHEQDSQLLVDIFYLLQLIAKYPKHIYKVSPYKLLELIPKRLKEFDGSVNEEGGFNVGCGAMYYLRDLSKTVRMNDRLKEEGYLEEKIFYLACLALDINSIYESEGMSCMMAGIWLEYAERDVFLCEKLQDQIIEKKILDVLINAMNKYGIKSEYTFKVFQIHTYLLETEYTDMLLSISMNENLLKALKAVLNKATPNRVTEAAADCAKELFYNSTPDFCKKLGKGFDIKKIIKSFFISSEERLIKIAFELLENYFMIIKDSIADEFLEKDKDYSFFEFTVDKFPGKESENKSIDAALSYLDVCLEMGASKRSNPYKRILVESIHFQNKIEDVLLTCQNSQERLVTQINNMNNTYDIITKSKE